MPALRTMQVSQTVPDKSFSPQSMHSFRLGRRVLYRAEDLHAWINAQASSSTTADDSSDSGSQTARAVAT